MKTLNIVLEKRNPKVGSSIANFIKIGKENFELLNTIKSNTNLSRKDLVNLVINHPSFIYKNLKASKAIAWDLIQKSKRTTTIKPYELRDTNGGKKNGLWICYFDFSMTYAR